MSRYAALIGFAAGLLAASNAAAALNFEVIGTSVSYGHSLDALQIGDEITIDIRMSNPTGAVIRGVGAAVQEYAPNRLQFVSGEAVVTPFFCNDPACTSGLLNGVEDPLHESYFLGYGPFVHLIHATTPRQFSGDGSRDPGLDGVVGGGDAQFRVVFRVLPAARRNMSLNIGTFDIQEVGNFITLNGGATVQANNATVELFVLPEPGSAMLLGLGLAGLSRGRTRRSNSRAASIRH